MQNAPKNKTISGQGQRSDWAHCLAHIWPPCNHGYQLCLVRVDCKLFILELLSSAIGMTGSAPCLPNKKNEQATVIKVEILSRTEKFVDPVHIVPMDAPVILCESAKNHQTL